MSLPKNQIEMEGKNNIARKYSNFNIFTLFLQWKLNVCIVQTLLPRKI